MEMQEIYSKMWSERDEFRKALFLENSENLLLTKQLSDLKQNSVEKEEPQPVEQPKPLPAQLPTQQPATISTPPVKKGPYWCEWCGVNREEYEVSHVHGNTCGLCGHQVEVISGRQVEVVEAQKKTVEAAEKPTDTSVPAERKPKEIDFDAKGMSCPVCGRTISESVYESLKKKFSKYVGLFQ